MSRHNTSKSDTTGITAAAKKPSRLSVMNAARRHQSAEIYEAAAEALIDLTHKMSTNEGGQLRPRDVMDRLGAIRRDMWLSELLDVQVACKCPRCGHKFSNDDEEEFEDDDPEDEYASLAYGDEDEDAPACRPVDVRKLG